MTDAQCEAAAGRFQDGSTGRGLFNYKSTMEQAARYSFRVESPFVAVSGQDSLVLIRFDQQTSWQGTVQQPMVLRHRSAEVWTFNEPSQGASIRVALFAFVFEAMVWKRQNLGFQI